MATASSTSAELKSSAALLTGANVVSAAIGVSQGLLVLRLLGPDVFGAAAVLVALGAVATNLIDVRVTDLVSKLYFDDRARRPITGTAYRAAALRLGLRFYACGAALIAIVSFVVMALAAHRLTGIELVASWLWVAAAAHGVSYLGSFFIFVQRFGTVPRRMAVVQLASAAVNAAAMVAAVGANRTVGGYVIGLMGSATGIALLNAWQAGIALRQDGVALFGVRPSPALAMDRRMILRFLAAGNVVGYAKLLHRAGDVLLVAAFCGDRETGIYKLARAVTDALYTTSEAISRIYQPRLLALLQFRNHLEYAAVARSLTAIAAVVTAVAIGAEIVLIPYVAPLLGVTDVQLLTLSVVTLTVAFFFAAGVQSWMWPVFVFVGRLDQCALWGILAVLVGQYALGTTLFQIAGDGSPFWFCVGYLSYYPLSLLPLWRELQRERFGVLPERAGAATA